MVLFRKLAFASTFATFLLVAIGGLVRATKSGLGCGTDWPDCSGRLIPMLHTRALAIEYAHRVAAAAVVMLIAALAVVAIVRFRRSRRVVWPCVGALAIVLSQALLGAVVVKLELEAVAVVLHLATAMVLVAVLVYLCGAVLASERRFADAADPGVARLAATAAATTLALLLLGSYVTGSGAGFVFPDWPLMNGRVVPDLSRDLYAIHFLHRAFSVLTGVVVAAAVLKVMRRKSEMPLAASLAQVAAGLFAVEILIGAANVWTGLNPVAVTAHLIVGVLIWASLVAVVVVVHPALRPSLEESAVGSPRAALEPGR